MTCYASAGILKNDKGLKQRKPYAKHEQSSDPKIKYSF